MKKILLTLFIIASLILPVQGNADITKFGGFLPCTSDNGTLCTTSRYISTPGITLSTSATFSFLTSGYLPKAGTGGALGNSAVYQDSSANIGLGTATFGTSAAKVIGIPSGTAPTTSPTDAAQVWTADHNAQAGYARLYERTEDGKSAPIALLSEVETYKNPLAFAQGIKMTAASAAGIVILDNDNIDAGISNFSLRAKLSIPHWIPSATVYLCSKVSGGVGAYYGYYWFIDTNGKLNITLYRNSGGTTYTSTVATGLTDGTPHTVGVDITRETAGSAGSIVFSVDGYQLGSAVAITAVNPPVTISNTGNLYINGLSSSARADMVLYEFIMGNYAFSTAEVLSLYKHGIDFADKWGSQTEQTSGTLTVGKRYRINNWITDDDFTNVGGANVDGTEFTATGTTPTKWTNSSTVVQIGATLALENEGIQPAPGQWLDSSSNKLHALQPASGSSLVRPMRTFEIRDYLNWDASSSAKYVNTNYGSSSVNGTNQAVLPANFYITDIVTYGAGADIENIEIGDGSDVDRFVTAVGPTGYVTHTLANRVGDGTNFKLVITPAAEATMTLKVTVRGIILE